MVVTSFQLPYVLDAESILSICLWLSRSPISPNYIKLKSCPPPANWGAMWAMYFSKLPSIYCFHACVNTPLGIFEIFEIVTSRKFYLSKSYRSAKSRWQTACVNTTLVSFNIQINFCHRYKENSPQVPKMSKKKFSPTSHRDTT